MTKEGKTILAVMAIMFCFGLYGYNELSEVQQSIKMQASTCNCPMDNKSAVTLHVVSDYVRTWGATSSYFEHLLEGIARREGLPLEKAREAWRKGLADVKMDVPKGWRYLKPWEGKAAPNPPVTKKPASDDKAKPTDTRNK